MRKFVLYIGGPVDAKEQPAAPPADLRHRVEAVLNRLRPYLQSDGGDMEVANINEEEGIVFLRLQGACSGCPSSMMTLKMGIENELRAQIPEIKEVISI